jgi:hypothetical protein
MEESSLSLNQNSHAAETLTCLKKTKTDLMEEVNFGCSWNTIEIIICKHRQQSQMIVHILIMDLRVPHLQKTFFSS